MTWPKSVRFGRFLIRSESVLTPNQMRILNRRNCEAIELVWKYVLRGTWTIVEVRK